MPIEAFTKRALAYAEAREIGVAPYQTDIDGLTLVRSLGPTRLEPTLYKPIVCLVLQGAKQSLVGGEPVTFAAGQSLIVSHDLPTVRRIVRASPREPYLALALRIDMTILRELAGAVEAGEIAEEEARILAAGEADADAVDAMRRLFDLVDRPAAARVLAPLIVKELHFRLLAARHGAMLRRLASVDSHASRVARAIAILHRDFAAPLQIADLASAVGMSPSSFHAHFRAVTAITPLQFQKRLRLMEARRLLLAGETSVGAAAYRVGYESPTQFSREYSREFGRSPRNDLVARAFEES